MFVTHTMFGVCDYDEGCKFDYYRSDDCLSLDFPFLFCGLQYHHPWPIRQVTLDLGPIPVQCACKPTTFLGFSFFTISGSSVARLLLNHESSQFSHQKHKNLYSERPNPLSLTRFLFSFPSALSLLLRLDLAPIPDIMSLFCLPMSSVCIFFFTNMRDDWNGEMPN